MAGITEIYTSRGVARWGSAHDRELGTAGHSHEPRSRHARAPGPSELGIDSSVLRRRCAPVKACARRFFCSTRFKQESAIDSSNRHATMRQTTVSHCSVREQENGSHRMGPDRFRSHGGCVAAVLALMVTSSALTQPQEDTPIGKPIVREAVSPFLQTADLRALTRTRMMRAWRPGDPVTVVEDLKERLSPGGQRQEQGGRDPDEAKQPIIRKAVPPRRQGSARDIGETRAANRWAEGDPVRVMEDLRIQPAAGAGCRCRSSG